METSDPTVVVGGISIVRATSNELAARMVADCATARAGRLARPKFVTSCNGQTLALYHKDAEYRALIAKADIVDADGMPIVLASRLLSREPLRERIATTDFIYEAGRAAQEHGVRFYFLGARPGVAQVAADKLHARYPNLQIVGVRNGYFTADEEHEIVDDVRRQATDVLWIGLGTPRQEQFVARHRERLGNVAWLRTCGGLFDHMAGVHPRAPGWMQRLGLEWAFRLAREPRRLGRRYLTTNPQALYHLLSKTPRAPAT